jgi:hypothetical protein
MKRAVEPVIEDLCTIPMFFPVDTIPPQIHCQFIRNSLVIHRTMVLCSHQDAEVGGTEGKATETKIAMI